MTRRGIASVTTAALLTSLPVLALAPPQATAAGKTSTMTQSALQRAGATGEPVEVTSERTEYSQTVANPDGTFTLTQSTTPQRAKAPDGSWQNIDTTLVRRTDGTVGPKSAVVNLDFSGGGPGAGMLQLGTDEQSMKFGWPGTLPTPALNGATATYAHVLKDVDLQLTATAEGYREVLVVKTAEAAHSPELENIKLTASAKGLSVIPGAGGGLRAVDSDGNAVFTGPAGQMWDSAGGTLPPSPKSKAAEQRGGKPSQPTAAEQPGTEGGDPTHPGDGAASAELPVTVTASAVSVAPDLDLLRGKDTVYPVYIDPPVGLGVSERTKLSSDGDKFWQFDKPMGVGKCGNADGYYCGSGYTDRMYFEFAPTKLSGKYVIDATFRAHETWSFNCTPYWVDLKRTDNISEGTRWPGPKTLDHMGDRYISAGRDKNCSPAQPDTWVEFNDNPQESDENLASTVRSFADGKIHRLTLMLRATDESEPRAWKRFDDNAELKVNYVPRPGLPTSVGAIPATGTTAYCRTSSSDPLTVTTATPTVQARVQTKVQPKNGEEKGSLQAEFWMERKNGSSWDKVWSDYKPDKGWDPDGTLEKAVTSQRADGGLYRFKSRTQSHWYYGSKSGDLFSPYSSWCYLKIDTSAPKAPQITSTGPYTECTTSLCEPKGGPGIAGAFTFKPHSGESGVKGYRYRLLTTSKKGAKTVSGATPAVKDVTPSLPGTQVLSVEATDLDADGRVRYGPPSEYVFKASPAEGNTGRWHFDDAPPGSAITTAADRATVGTRHNATLYTTGAGWSTLARRGAHDYSLWMDSADPNKQHGYAATSTPALNTGDSFTVSAWVYLTDTTANHVVLTEPGEHASAFTLYYSATTRKWVFNRTDQDSKTASYIRSPADSPNPTTRVWTHLAGVFDTQHDADPKNDTIQLFVNGRPQGQPVTASTVSTYKPWTASEGLQFGRSKVADLYGENWRGRIDEVALWQRPLNADELHQEAALEQDGVPANELVGHWDAAISQGASVRESPEDPDDPSSTGFPYGRGPLKFSATGASLKDEDGQDQSLVLNGSTGYATATGPVVDETGSFTVSARVRLDSAGLAKQPVGYRAAVFSQAAPAGKESSWALWVEKPAADTYLWKFGRTAVDATGKVTDTGLVTAQEPISPKELNSWVDLTGVFDAAETFTDDDGQQQLGMTHLYIGQFPQQPEGEAGFATPQQGSGDLTAGNARLAGTTSHYLPGALAELRVWTGAMTADQVRSQVLAAPDDA
ncbi:LamG domain-containing protein [Streptomyces tubercidicus]|uniref:LamG domain-containing protein n=1 Tax=Streptomyces tubercidicus TaxID=47759 RepID=UPI001FE627F0|nr:LamG domain-containing protein [Streptomyces tubercidicus]WAU09981.1 LamG domain-containing protein [Streptomyces tubercidicus]WAU16346.1 LamG domain-containing protein [Streptomyces tubercidicus]